MTGVRTNTACVRINMRRECANMARVRANTPLVYVNTPRVYVNTARVHVNTARVRSDMVSCIRRHGSRARMLAVTFGFVARLRRYEKRSGDKHTSLCR